MRSIPVGSPISGGRQLRRSTRIAVLALSLAVAFAGCRREDETPSQAESGGQLVIGVMALPGALNPLVPGYASSAGIRQMLYAPLFRQRPDGTTVPWLAKRWQFSEDLRQIIFYVHDGAAWSDGTPITGRDVRFTFERIHDSGLRSTYGSLARPIESVETREDGTVLFGFEHVFSRQLRCTGFPILPEHILRETTDFSSPDFAWPAVASGPFALSARDDGRFLQLRANPRYFDAPPSVSAIVLWQAPDGGALTRELILGHLDIAEGVPPDCYESLRTNREIILHRYQPSSVISLVWNLRDPLVSTLSMRRALTHAIDRRELVEDPLCGLGEVATGPLPSSFWAAGAPQGSLLDFDTTAADRLLEEEGWRRRRGRRWRERERQPLEITLLVNRAVPAGGELAGTIADQLARVGASLNVVVVGPDSLRQLLEAGTFTVALLERPAGNDFEPTAWWHSDPNLGCLNVGGYASAAVDSLLECIDRRAREDEVAEEWAELEHHLAEDLPATDLVEPERIVAVHRRVQGFDDRNRDVYAQLDRCWIPRRERVTIDLAMLGTVLEEEPAVAYAPTPMPTPTPAALTPEEMVETVEAVMSESAAAETMAEASSLPPFHEPVTVEPQIVSLSQARYPTSARAVRAQGLIELDLLIGTDGRPRSARVATSFGHPACEQAAIEAAMASVFTPGTRDAVPQEMWVRIPYTFRP